MTEQATGPAADLHRLPLHQLHLSLAGRMVPFAGYDMPVQYAPGVMKEHLWTRESAGLFDVSHMGQILLRPRTTMTDLARALEALMPVDVLSLAEGRQRYGLLTNAAGGILDDLMFANRGDHFLVVVNAACKVTDLAHLQTHLHSVAEVIAVTDRGLLALQGPLAENALAALAPAVTDLRFMDVTVVDSAFGALWISRSGYTGEDGFEISVPEAGLEGFAHALLADHRVQPVGLGARDSLRLEAGLCLYGHDMDAATSPPEAALNWAIPKVRRAGGARMGGFPGSEAILDQIAHGPPRIRVGLRPEGRAPMREGTTIHDGDREVGHVTSGGFGPSVGGPIAMARVDLAVSAPGTQLTGSVRGKMLPVTVCPLPFHPTTYKR